MHEHSDFRYFWIMIMYNIHGINVRLSQLLVIDFCISLYEMNYAWVENKSQQIHMNITAMSKDYISKSKRKDGGRQFSEHRINMIITTEFHHKSQLFKFYNWKLLHRLGENINTYCIDDIHAKECILIPQNSKNFYQ